MLRVTINQWGNSVGIRIPAAIIKANEIEVGEEFSVSSTQDGGVLLTPVKRPQMGWENAFNRIAEKQNSPKNDGKVKEELIPFIANRFDDEDWTW
jgi:antitoxin component of MazEF toxin-antitoxin module